jgi:hypothetical protein
VRHSGSSIALFLLLSIGANPAFAKGETVRLEISGADLAATVNVTDNAAIAANAWGVNYLEWEKGPVPAPAPEMTRYTVKFYIQPSSGDIQMKYAVYFVWDETAKRGYVYLPGQADALYRLNSAIVRDNGEAQWYLATDSWANSLHQSLAGAH